MDWVVPDKMIGLCPIMSQIVFHASVSAVKLPWLFMNSWSVGWLGYVMEMTSWSWKEAWVIPQTDSLRAFNDDKRNAESWIGYD